MATEAEIIASNLLSLAIENKRLYDTTKNIQYREKEQRLRRIAENIKLLVASTSTSAVTSFNSRTGAITLTSADVTGALGYTPATILDGLNDVTISAPANGQVLIYNSTTNQWENQTPAGGGGGGDMLKSTYDVDNDGTVDSAETIQIIVRNSTGSTLTKGTVVYLNGATGNRPNAVRAQADTEATSSKTIGIVVADINNNSDGYVAVNGTLHDLDTSAFTAGDSVWLSATTAGAYTSTIPAEPNHTVFIGYIARSHPTQGRLVILIQNGYELNELHGVQISSEANNDLLVYESSSTLWKNKSISTIFGGTPLVSTPTLAQVTTAGNTTTNAITVGNATVNGPVNSVFAHTPTTNYTGFGGVQLNVADGTERGFFKLNPQTGEVKIGSIGSGYFTTLHTAGVERMRIFFSTGNVAINSTTDAGYKLDVNGSLRVVNDITSNSTFIATSTSLSGSTKYFSIIRSTDGNNPYYVTSDKVYMQGVFFQLSGQGGGAIYSSNSIGNATTYITMSGPAYYNPTSGVAGIFAVTGQSYMGSGTAQFNTLTVGPTINNTGTYSGIFRGFYYNPTLTSLTGTTHRAIETTSGDVIFGSTSGSVIVAATSTSSMQYGETPKLYVNGGTYLNGNIQLGTNNIRVSGNNISWESTGITNNLPEWRADATGIKFGNYLSLPLRISINGTENARFFSTGNVAIGTTTDAGYKLDVNGTFRVTNSSLNTLVASAGAISGRVDSLTFNTTTNTYYGLVFTPHNSDGEIRFRNSNSASIVSEGRLFSISTSTTNTGYSGSAFTFTGGTSVVAGQGSGSTWNIFNFNPVIATPNAGAGTYNILLVGGSLDFTGGGTGITRGIYINPTLTSLSTFIGLEIAKGKVITSSSVTASSALAQGVYFNNTLVAAANNDTLVGLDINPTFTNGAFTGVSNYGLRATGTGILAYFRNSSGGNGNLANGVTINVDAAGNGLITSYNYTPTDPTSGISAGANFGLNGSTVNFYGIGLAALRSSKYDIWFQTGAINGGGYRFYKGTTELFTIFQSGNVAINTTTDSGYKLDVNGSFRSNGDTLITAANGRIAGFTGLAAGQTVHLQYGGDSNHRLSTPYGSGVTFDAYHGVTVRTSPASTGKALIVNQRNSTHYIQEWQDNGTQRAFIDSSGNLFLSPLNTAGDGFVTATGGILNTTAYGYTGIITFPTNPPGQQNLDFQNGILVNVF